MKRTFSGAASGAGAIYEWEGEQQRGLGTHGDHRRSPAGQGDDQARLHEAVSREQRRQLHARAERRRHDRQTGDAGPQRVRRQIDGRVLFNMDDMVGGQFEAGLAAMKAAAER